MTLTADETAADPLTNTQATGGLMTGSVTVRLKPGVLDPQGETIHRSLRQMGYDWVESVRSAKTFEIRLAAADADSARAKLTEISQKLLANPVIETFEVEVRG